MSHIFTIKQIQHLSIPVSEAWNFFSNPRNLIKITPPSLDFKIISDITDSIYEGQLITYKVKPLFGISVKWVTEITKVEFEKLFIDEQIKGPYSMWHHEHHFKSADGGTEMTDIVQYKIPFGTFGLLALPIVKMQLKTIFDYRQKVIEELFVKR